MKKRVIALMLAFVLVLNMGTVAFANGEATPAPVTETEPTPTPAAEATPTPTPVVEETPTPTPAADPTPTSTPAVEATPTPTPTPEVVLASIRVTQMPDKLEYLCTDTAVDSTGGTLMLTFSDGTTQVVDLSAATLSLVKENANTASVNVAYEGMTDSFAVTIEHSYDEGVITTEATATEPGVMTYTCADCGDEQIGEIPMAVATEIASGTCGDNLTWSLSEEGVLTISGTGVMDNYDSSSLSSRPWHEYISEIKEIVIQSGVTGIGNYAFYGCSSLESITIPDSVTSIGGSAFSYCSSLSSITIPDSVTSIGSYTFYGCAFTTAGPVGSGCDYEFGWTDSIPSYAFSGCSSLSSITIPNGVTSIGEYAFYGCSSLSSITIPDGVTGIGQRAFYNCRSLRSITIPDNVTWIGMNAFSGCNGLTSIAMPVSVEIRCDAFAGCTGITTVTLTKGSGKMPSYFLYNGCTSNHHDWTPWYVARDNSITVIMEDGITNIVDYAFSGCSGLTSIEIPDSVTWIGVNAFSGCYSLTNITMPVSARITANSSFGSCTGITSVTLTKGSGSWTMVDSSYYSEEYKFTPWYKSRKNNITVTIEEGVTSIGSKAFYDCSGLSSIQIPDSVTSVGNSAFYRCSKLLTAGPVGGGYNIEMAYTNAIPYNAFSGCTSLREVSIPNGVKKIDSYAFEGCTSLKDISIPDSVESIGSSAFKDCTSFRYISIPESVTSIGSSAFEGCTYLRYIRIPESVTSIGSSVFYGCRYLNTAGPVESGIYQRIWSIKFGWTDTIPANAFSYSNYLDMIKIPEGVTSIGSYAFSDCTSLSSITLPESLTSIANGAFDSCKELSKVFFKGDISSIAANTFNGVTATVKYLHTKSWPEDKLQDYGGTLTWQLCCENFEECEVIKDEAVAPTFDSTGLTEGSHCSVCEKPIVAQNELPKLAVTELEITAPDKLVYYKGESLDSTGLTVTAKLNNDTNIDVTDQVQLEGFSSNAAGTKTITVSFKDAQATFDVQVFSFTSVSLSLEGRVIINFYANFPDYAEAGYTPGILFFRKQPDGDEIVAAYNAGEGVTSYVVADNGALMFSYDKLAAKELNDKVYATLYAVQDDGKVVFGTPTPISAAEYAISTFGLYANDARLQTLMVDMLNFGAAAQNEFDYRTNALANSNMSATMAAKATKDNVSLSNGMKLYKDGLSSDKVTIKSASLSLDNEISINFYAEIKGDIKKAELLIFDEYTAGGVYDKNTASKRTDMVPHEDMYAGFITGIAAKSMRDLYYARVYVQFEDGTEAYSGIGQYSVESYAWQVRNGSGFSSKLKLLMEEMMKYGDSAKMYMENKNNNANG